MDTFASLATAIPLDLGNRKQQYHFILESIACFNFSNFIFYYKNLHAKDQYYGISNLVLQDNGLPIFFSLDKPTLSLESMQDKLSYSKPTLVLWNTQTWRSDKDLMYLLRNFPIMFGVTVPILNQDNILRGSITFLRDHLLTVSELLDRTFEFKQMLFATQFTLENEITGALSRLTHPKELYLNSRQIDILRLLANGLSTEDVAKLLDVQLSTINYHLKTIYQVTNTNNRTTAVYRALKAGLID